MSDNRLTPDGVGGFHLPDGGRLSPDGAGGYHVIGTGIGGGFSGLEILFLMFVVGVPVLGFINSIGFMVWLWRKKPLVGLVATLVVIGVGLIDIQYLAIVIYVVGFVCLPFAFAG